MDKVRSGTVKLRDKIKELHAQGLTNRQIALGTNVHHNTVAYHMAKMGLSSNFANEPIDMVSETEARCKKCKEIKLLVEFQFGRKGQKYEYKFSYCNECRKKQVYLNLNNDINKFLIDKYHRLVNRCNKFNIICSITKEEFIAQYYNQKGKCFYTDEKLVWGVGNGKDRYSISTDKIIPEYGYISGNIVFCINKINTCKNDLNLMEIKKWMPPLFNKIAEYYGAEERIKVGSKVFVDDIHREHILGVSTKTIFVVTKIGPEERIVNGNHFSGAAPNFIITPTSKKTYRNVWLKDIRDLKNDNAKEYGPIDEFAMVYLWQLLGDQ